jgi:hypothetical protein
MELLAGSDRGGTIAASSSTVRKRPDWCRESSSQLASEMGCALAEPRTFGDHLSTVFWYIVDVPSNKPLKRMVGRGRPPTA